MSAGECVFCRMAVGQIPVVKVYEDEAVLAFLDIGPISDGHTLVIPKQHFEKLNECSVECLSRVSSCFGRIAGAVAKAMNSDGYNVLCNNGRVAGQVVNHLHFHIIPRRRGDGLFTQWPAYRYQEGQIAAIAEKIRENM